MGQVWVENRLNFSGIEAFFNFIFGFESLDFAYPYIVADKQNQAAYFFGMKEKKL